MKVWPVKHSPLLRQPERFIARSELKALIPQRDAKPGEY